MAQKSQRVLCCPPKRSSHLTNGKLGDLENQPFVGITHAGMVCGRLKYPDNLTVFSLLQNPDLEYKMALSAPSYDMRGGGMEYVIDYKHRKVPRPRAPLLPKQAHLCRRSPRPAKVNPLYSPRVLTLSHVLRVHMQAVQTTCPS